MSRSMSARLTSCAGPSLRLWREPTRDRSTVFWRINGYRATLKLWTQDEWARMDARPLDAQYHPSGVWCALRME
jgi:hypothetical protein